MFIKGGGYGNIITMFMNFVCVFEGLDKKDLMLKLVCYGVDCVFPFKSLKRVTMHLNEKHSLIMINIHYMACRCKVMYMTSNLLLVMI
jgi:hypothetical protein